MASGCGLPLGARIGTSRSPVNVALRHLGEIGVLLRVLSVIQEQGWVERQVGHGWRFMPMIDSLKAYEESYLFRAAIEAQDLAGAAALIKEHIESARHDTAHTRNAFSG
jgi:DNA-binding GntR family transcriptional regulator